MKLGMFDAHTPFDTISYDSVDCDAHRTLNYESACKSLVLLRNEALLPLDISTLHNVAVIGPNANSIRALEGNYHGTANQYHTVLESIRAALPGVRVNYSVGSHLHQLKLEDPGYSGDRLGEVSTQCELADVVVLVVGLDESIESEDKGSKTGFSGDKLDLLLPQSQQDLVRVVMESGKPTVIVCMSGSALDLGVGNQADAIIQAWYPGAMGGKAVSDLIFGKFSPSGKLPVTFYTNETPLPAFEDYSMDGRTYKFFQGSPLYPFGFGLSYTTFVYSDLEVDARIVQPDGSVKGSVIVHNQGAMDSDEVVQFYIRDLQASVRVPRHALCAVGRVSLRAGEAKRVPFTIGAQAFQVIAEDGSPFFEKGKYLLFAGSCQPDETSARLIGRPLERICTSIELEVL
jgi:beta-glucosidase